MQQQQQADSSALTEVRALLGDQPRRADLLVEHLHLIQDRYHHLSARHLIALAVELGLSATAVRETAASYPCFEVIAENAAPPPAISVRICDSLSCEMAGSAKLLETLKDKLAPAVRVTRAPCLGHCDKAPIAKVSRRPVMHASVGSVVAAVRGPSHAPLVPPWVGFDEYAKNGGYRLYRACLAGGHSAEEIIRTMEDSGLRGTSSSGASTGRTWRLLRQEPAARLMVVNGNESEPGAFKDRLHLETDPHRMLEGMLVAAWAVEATDVYLYLRDEYSGVREIMHEEIAKLERAGLTEKTRIHLRRGTGSFVCGDETAMLESIEGLRREPRHKPLIAARAGLFGRPTLISDVESLYWVRDIVERGPAWFSGQGRNGRKGLRTFSVSGRIKEPGMKLAPAGITANQLIAEYCDGMVEGQAFKAYLPSGVSGGILPASMADIPLDVDTLEPHGCTIGSAAVVVLSDRDDIRAVALNLMRFFEQECRNLNAPERLNVERAVRLMEAPAWDLALLNDLNETLKATPNVVANKAVATLLSTVLRHFGSELG